MHLTRSPRYDRRQALQLTAMVEVPREPEAVRGEVEVPDLVGEHGGVALLPRRDGQVVTGRVIAQRDVLHPGQFLCEIFGALVGLKQIFVRLRLTCPISFMPYFYDIIE